MATKVGVNIEIEIVPFMCLFIRDDCAFFPL